MRDRIILYDYERTISAPIVCAGHPEGPEEWRPIVFEIRASDVRSGAFLQVVEAQVVSYDRADWRNGPRVVEARDTHQGVIAAIVLGDSWRIANWKGMPLPFTFQTDGFVFVTEVSP